MKLTGRKATFCTHEVTIITEPVLDRSDKFVVLTLNSDGRFVKHYVVDLVLVEGIELADANDERSEWQPDWSKIKYDHLRMDLDGAWFSFNSDKLCFSEVTFDWRFTREEKGRGFNREYSITYKHPNPEKAIYTRPETR